MILSSTVPLGLRSLCYHPVRPTCSVHYLMHCLVQPVTVQCTSTLNILWYCPVRSNFTIWYCTLICKCLPGQSTLPGHLQEESICMLHYHYIILISRGLPGLSTMPVQTESFLVVSSKNHDALLHTVQLRFRLFNLLFMLLEWVPYNLLPRLNKIMWLSQ